MSKPIFILGLGRSGTTWVSDIVSKYSGGLILFEPLHPQVYSDISSVIYRESILSEDITDHIDAVLSKHLKHDWLLRNHLPSTVDQVDPRYIEKIWEHSKIIGIKSIRLNTSFAALAQHFNAMVVYIIRHPLAVIASIRNRPQFWEDLGWVQHWNLLNDQIQETKLKDLSTSCNTRVEQLAFIWGYLNLIALKQLKQINNRTIFYEDLYAHPFEQVRALLRSIDLYDHPIHPSHIFTSSMVSLNTLHPVRYSSIDGDHLSLDFFWQDSISDDEIKSIHRVLRELCDYDQDLAEMCAEREYL